MALLKAKESNKKQEIVAFQIEVETAAQWRNLLRREGLIIVDVYASWAGPCVSMVNIFKRLKVEVNDDRLWLAIACSDNIDDLLMFKDQSEPTWLFIGGGKPIKVFRGTNVPKFMTLIKQEFEHELSCIAGKARRNLISIDDEDSRRKKAEAEAARLQKIIKDEETTAAEDLNALRRESSIRLMDAMSLYTVLVVQNFVIKQGSVNEIKDYLEGDFKIEQEVYINLDDEGARNLFRIPTELVDPNEPVNEFGVEGEEATEENQENTYDETEDGAPKPKPKRKKKKTIPVEIPAGVLGETLVMVLECVDLRKMLDSKKKPPSSSLLQTADDYIQLKVGPKTYAEAVEHAPYSLHAVYGKGLYAPGVWCPRSYEDKRYVMINFFPRFVTEVLMPQAPSEPKYMLAVYPVEMAKEVMEHTDIVSQGQDVLAQGKVKISPALADEMLKAWKVQGGEVLARKKALTSNQVFAVSVNKRNSTLRLAIKGLKPLHTSYDNTYGKVETATLFQKLNIDVKNIPDPDVIVQKFLARSGPRVEAIPDENESLPPTQGDEINEDENKYSQEAPKPSSPMVDKDQQPSEQPKQVGKAKKSEDKGDQQQQPAEEPSAEEKTEPEVPTAEQDEPVADSEKTDGS